jgi:hypothetical protein
MSLETRSYIAKRLGDLAVRIDARVVPRAVFPVLASQLRDPHRSFPQAGVRHRQRILVPYMRPRPGEWAERPYQKSALDAALADEHDQRSDLDILVRTVTAVPSREGVNTSSDETMPEFIGSGLVSTAGGDGWVR